MSTGDDLDDDRPAGPLDLSRCALGVAVDAARLAAGLVTELGEVVSAQRIPLPVGNDSGELFDTVVGMVDAVLHAAGTEPDEAARLPGIGVSVAGVVDRDAGTVTPEGIWAWRSFPLRDRLIARYGSPVRSLDESVAVIVGEHWRGAARGRRNVLGVTIGDHVGGGVLVDGRLVTGTTGNAGHLGHVTVDPYGAECACGGRGCLDVIAGGAAIAAWAVTHGFAHPGATALDVAEAALRGVPVAQATFRRAGEAIGVAVANAVTLLDLDVVVVGGPVAAAGGSALADPIADGYARFAGLGYAALPRVVPALLGADAALIGAAAAVLHPATYPSSDR